MPRPTRSQGRPNTVVWPDNWETDHAVVIDKTHKATVWIGPPGTTPTWNNTTHQTETTPAAAVYEGEASISIASLAGASAGVQIAEDYVEQRKYLVTILQAQGAITEDHIVRVVTSTDTDLVDQVLRIDGVTRGSQRFSRHIQTTLT